MPAGFRYFVLVLFVLQLGVSGPAASTVGTATSDEQAMHALTMEALAHVRGVLKLDVDQVKQIQPLPLCGGEFGQILIGDLYHFL